MSENQDSLQKKEDVVTGRAKGGIARAKSLSADEKSAIARAGAKARWASAASKIETDATLPKATHPGTLKIGEFEIPCAVLDNKTRVITQRGMFVSLGMHKNPTKGQASIDNRPAFLAAQNLNPFIPEDLARSWNPIPFRLAKGSGGYRGNIAFGYDARIVPKVCYVFLDAYTAGKTTKRQKHIVDSCKILVRGFAEVGIIALVDEATGYQYDRERDELSKILEQYIAPGLAVWTQKFPHEFFKQVYRIHGWNYSYGQIKHPGYLGHFINKYVYGCLPSPVVEKMKEKSPKNGHGNRPNNLWQWLTADTGEPHLDRVLASDITLLQVSDDKEEFERNWEKVHGRQQPLNF